MDRGANITTTFGRLKITSSPRTSALTAHHAPTSPIPHSAPIAMAPHSSTPSPTPATSYTPSFMEQANRTRKSSISFDPSVRLESGSQHPLASPLPHGEHHRPPARAYTWSENDNAPSDPFGMFFQSSVASSAVNEDPMDESCWSSPRRFSSSTRNKSFSSLDGRTRSRSRRSAGGSERSASPRFGGGSSQLSPANMFLNTFTAPPVTAPDSEGQEVGAYVLGKQIGVGGTSTIKEAFTIENHTSILRAVKIVRKTESDPDTFDHEVSIWRCLNHPHILPLIAVYDTPFATFAFMRLNTGGTLHSLLKANRSGLPAHTAARYAFQLACALRYLHEDMRLVHRDVKLENCLIEDTTLQLCDFGMAEFDRAGNDDDDDDDNGDDDDSDSSGNAFAPLPLSPARRQQQQSSRRRRSSASSRSAVLSTPAGSLEYAAPETFADGVASTVAVDMWAFGVVVYALFTGVLPFRGGMKQRVVAAIVEGDWDEGALVGCAALKGREEEARWVLEVVRGCLKVEVEERWDVRAVLESRWLEGQGECV